MKKFFNYIGQIRLYSLADLILLLIAFKADNFEFFGVILLHLGFLLYLERKHSHHYREEFFVWIWILLIIFGAVLYKHIEFLPFLLFSYLYAKKSDSDFGTFSPVFRGLQVFFLVAGIAGYYNVLTWAVLPIIFVRNFMGDLRDARKDRKDGLKTLPIVLGFRKGSKYIHLIAIMVTSLIWWSFADIFVVYLFIVFAIEIITYNLTVR